MTFLDFPNILNTRYLSTLRNWSKHELLDVFQPPQKISTTSKPVNHLFNNSYVIGFACATTLYINTYYTCTRCRNLKRTNLESYNSADCHLEIDRDHMATTNI
eukprot:NODE_412_length_9112_cov_0.674692.p7 type:complete len:103 gc:universal NODE_412_length_9112_cov_0.674692:4170-3862(-)